MRVCVVTIAGRGLGGMQDHTRDLARGLVAAGHDVELITTRHPDGIRSEERDGARWHFVDAPGRHTRAPLHHPGWLKGSLALFRRLHEHHPFDVVHSESTSALELVRRGEHRRVPLVVEYHGNFIGLTRAAWRRARQGRARERVREAKAFVWMCAMHLQRGECLRFNACEWIVPSRQQFEDTRRGEFLRRSRGHVVPNGIDTDRFRPGDRAAARAELDLDESPLLLSVGRLNREKGMDLAIRALASLGADGGARLVLVGSGEEEDSLRSLAAGSGVRDRARFAGQEPPERVATWMAAADVFLFPTLREEAAPLVLLQAMACGVPVVASGIGGITEVIGPSGGNGILIPPGDEQALVAEVRALLADPGARERIGTAARARILAEYTLERMVERTVNVYTVAIRRMTTERA